VAEHRSLKLFVQDTSLQKRVVTPLLPCLSILRFHVVLTARGSTCCPDSTDNPHCASIVRINTATATTTTNRTNESADALRHKVLEVVPIAKATGVVFVIQLCVWPARRLFPSAADLEADWTWRICPTAAPISQSSSQVSCPRSEASLCISKWSR
jgi:hypothetical protein